MQFPCQNLTHSVKTHLYRVSKTKEKVLQSLFKITKKKNRARVVFGLAIVANYPSRMIRIRIHYNLNVIHE